MVRPGHALLALWVGLVTSPAGAAPSFTATVEAGPELDTNATRVPASDDSSAAPQVAAPLLRLSGSASLKVRRGLHVLTLDYGGGVKLFLTEAARAADELVQLAGAGWATRTPAGTLWVSGSYYDAFQRASTRDFRTGGVLAQLLLPDLPGGFRAMFDLGYRGLGYKPLSQYGFHGLQGGAGVSWRASSGRGDAVVDWELRVGYSAGLRFYEGAIRALPARCSASEPFPCSEEGGRRDVHHLLRLEANYLGEASASLSYLAEFNRSNSYGESYTRHALSLKFTTALLWGISLTGKLTLQLSRFQDPLVVSQVSSLSFATTDDENRSSLVAQLARDLTERWAVILRYGLYVNESSVKGDLSQPLLTGAGFLRQTLFLGLRYEYGP